MNLFLLCAPSLAHNNKDIYVIPFVVDMANLQKCFDALTDAGTDENPSSVVMIIRKLTHSHFVVMNVDFQSMVTYVYDPKKLPKKNEFSISKKEIKSILSITYEKFHSRTLIVLESELGKQQRTDSQTHVAVMSCRR